LSANSEFLPPVQSSQDFESLCLDLWREIWGDPGAQKVGRSGQKQAGVDVCGKHAGRRVGVQCKQKDALKEDTLSATVLEKEVQKAKGFKPKLDSFILATTATRDGKIQAKARELSASAGFEVTVWSWDDIAEELFHRIDLLRSIFHIYWPTLDRLQKLPPQRVAPSRLPQAAAQLFGREREMAMLDAAWQDHRINVFTWVAWGGAGKTSLTAKWAATLAPDYGGADYFDWSFYSQGTRDHNTASGDAFVDAALRFFGEVATAESQVGAWDKGAKLAEVLARRKALLILDGLEPLQHSAQAEVKGQLKDPAIQALLRGLSARNAGLCVVTTRVPPTDLDNWLEGSAPRHALDRLSVAAGTALLKKLGVHGSSADLEETVQEVKGHALTLSLLGSFLRDAHDGDVRRRDLVNLDEADAESGDGHAFGVISAYEKYFEAEGEKGRRQLAILRLLGLFDRPASADSLAVLRKEPAISGLTEPLVGLSPALWKTNLKRLADAGLIDENAGTVDAHPLIREYFARQLRCVAAPFGETATDENTKAPKGHPGEGRRPVPSPDPGISPDATNPAWREAHGRLFDFLKESTEHRPSTLARLQPLYQAVYHGCQAGRQQEALDEVYVDRIARGAEAFVVKKLGAFGADLGAAACFFDAPWSRVSSSLLKIYQAWLLNEAAFRLRALGRLREALEPMRAGLKGYLSQENWRFASRLASNLGELELTMGDVNPAIADAEQAVVFADRCGDAFERMFDRTTLADARHQAGEEEAPLVLFREAERLQAERQPGYPLLYSLPGFRYCDLLLARAERAAGSGRDARAPSREEECAEVERRALKMFEWRIPSDSLLDIALDHLSLGRARLYRAILDGRASQGIAEARDEIERAVAGLRAAGDIQFVAYGLLTRAWLRFATGDGDGARADLDEAQEIAERGSMRLHLADVALYRGRFFHDREALKEARRLVEECGYGRRLPEIEDLEAAFASRSD
jgi:tetratricopeptide (TPR) repeat protein